VRPPPFDYVAPGSIDEVLDALARAGEDGKVLAGGQSLVPLLAMRLARPSVLVDVTRVAGLDAIAVDGDGWLRIGATARQRTVERSTLVRDRCPLVAEAVPLIAHPPIRSQGTVGGSLCHADPAAELPLVALVAGAELIVAGPDGTRTIPASSFFLGFLETALGPGEVLLAVRLPPVPPATGSAVVELARRHGDFAIAAVAAVAGPSSLEVWAAGVGAVPARLDVDAGAPLDHAATDATAALELADDLHGPPSWRRAVVRRLVIDAVTAARARAGA
jgi:CO/xanthine dehydrogenase FAD-binding subunit